MICVMGGIVGSSAVSIETSFIPSMWIRYRFWKGDRCRRTGDLQEALRLYDRAAGMLDGDLKAGVDGTAI
eukprot:13400-Eustigmatos_ZCMA.PRE.1